MSHQTAPSIVPDPLWILRGTTERQLVCRVSQVPSRLWIVTVKLAHETMLSESYPDAASALQRATALHEGMIGKGWSHVPVPPPQAT